MADNDSRDYITVEDEQGNRKDYAVEALFDMEDQSYALLKAEEEMVLMRVEGDANEQYITGIDDPAEAEAILNAYQVAVDAAPAEAE